MTNPIDLFYGASGEKKISEIIYLILIWLSFFQHASTVYSQNSNVEFFEFNNELGLAQSTIYSITQDSYGYLWIATQEGLNKFDGYKFQLFNYNPEVKGSLSNNNVSKVFIDKNKNLWVGTWGGGFCRFDRTTDEFITYEHDPKNPNSVSHNRVPVIHQDKNGILWLGTAGGGLNSFDPATNKFKHYRFIPDDTTSLSNDRIWGITEDNEGNLWIGTNYGFNKFNISKEKFERFYINGVRAEHSLSNIIRAIHFSQKNILWIGSEAGVYTLNLVNNKIRKVEEISKLDINDRLEVINCFYETTDGTLLIGTAGGGLITCNLKSFTFARHSYDQHNPKSLEGSDIRTITRDRSGLFWIGTRGNGLSTTFLKPPNFKNYSSRSNENLRLTGKGIKSVFIDNSENLWLGTNFDGLDILNLSSNTLKRFEHNSFLNDKRITSIKQDIHGNIWIGTYLGLYKFSPSTKKIEQLLFSGEHSIFSPINEIRCFEFGNDGLLWIGTYGGGLVQYDINDKKIKYFTTGKNREKSLLGNEIMSLLYDSEGLLWIATTDGLNSLNPVNGEMKSYGNSENSAYSMINLQSYSLHEDSKGKIWIGTSLGLYRFDKSTKKYTHFSTANGLSNNVVNSILEDSKGNIWISTNLGISKINYKTNKVINFDIRDGLQDNVFYIGSAFKSRKGFLYFGGVNGVTYFHPDSIELNNYSPDVMITKLESIGSEGPIDLLKTGSNNSSGNTRYDIYPGERILNIGFITTNYHIPGKNRYKYILEGFDKDWIDAGTNNSVRYTNLESGKYTLRVIGSNNDDIWAEKEAAVVIYVHPPFYKTWYFITGAVLFTALLLWLSFRYRVHSIKKQQNKLEELVEIKTAQLKENEDKLRTANAAKDKFFSIISHDLKNPFFSLMGFTSMLNTDYDTLDENTRKEIIKQIDTSSNLIYKLLENLLFWAKSQQNVIEVTKKEIDIDNAINQNIDLFKNTALQKGVFINYKPTGSVYVYADENLLNTVLRNLISNSVKFTNSGGYVEISHERKEKEITVKISDNGIGISKEKMKTLFSLESNTRERGTINEFGSGLGLILCKEFVNKNEGQIWVESEEGKGTTFYFTIPLSVIKKEDRSG